MRCLWQRESRLEGIPHANRTLMFYASLYTYNNSTTYKTITKSCVFKIQILTCSLAIRHSRPREPWAKRPSKTDLFLTGSVSALTTPFVITARDVTGEEPSWVSSRLTLTPRISLYWILHKCDFADRS
jgi:hypothetical protein